jgi:hypothetical protein
MPSDPLTSEHRIVSFHLKFVHGMKVMHFSRDLFENHSENALKSGESREADPSTLPLDVFRIL